MCRFYDPTKGEILLNGIDIRKYNYKEYVDLMSVVFQDFRLFSSTIKENVTSGQEEIDGQVNVTLAERQPGSSIKPFIYTLAFEKGYQEISGRSHG